MAADKSRWRDRFRTARRAMTAEQRAAAKAANTGHLLAALAGVRSVAGYLPLPSEPLAADLLDELVARGTRVLVPIAATDQPLNWADYPTATELGAFGIRTPIAPALGPGAVAEVEVVLVPAFGVDRRGIRLGRGGGHYDRTLESAPKARLIAVLFDGELVEALPADPHDVPVHAVVMPSSGLIEL